MKQAISDQQGFTYIYLAFNLARFQKMTIVFSQQSVWNDYLDETLNRNNVCENPIVAFKNISSTISLHTFNRVYSRHFKDNTRNNCNSKEVVHLRQLLRGARKTVCGRCVDIKDKRENMHILRIPFHKWTVFTHCCQYSEVIPHEVPQHRHLQLPHLGQEIKWLSYSNTTKHCHHSIHTSKWRNTRNPRRSSPRASPRL